MSVLCSTNALLPAAKVAEMMGVSVQTVRRLIKTGQLEAVKVGARFVRVPQESLEAYLQRKGGAK